MSTQNGGFPPVPLSANSALQNFRLLELPPDLLALLESGVNSGEAPNLRFTSSRAPANGGTGKSAEGFLHLCGDEKVWAIKQVSTSNSVYVTAATPAQHLNGDASVDHQGDVQMGESPEPPESSVHLGPGIATIAQVKNVLECIEVKSSAEDIERQLRAMLPACDDVADDGSLAQTRNYPSGDGETQSRHLTWDDLYANIPAPRKTIAEAHQRLFVFGVEDEHGNEVLRVPRPTRLLRMWELLAQFCAIDGVKLEAADSSDCMRIAERITESGDEPEWAVLQKLLDKVTPQLMQEDLWVPDQTSRQIGWWICQAHGSEQLESGISFADGRGSISQTQLLSKWYDMLPDAWSQYCTVENLGPGYEVSTDANGDDMVRFRVDGYVPKQGATPVETAASLKKRKWHEKFAAQRNQAAKK